MSELIRHKGLPALFVALILGLLLGGGAVAAVTISPHSVGWNKLTPGVQARIQGKPQVGQQGTPGAIGPEGPAGPQGPPGKDAEEREEPEPIRPPE